MDPQLLLYRLELGEAQDLEFKSGRNGFPRSFWETYSAMANTEGGTIVLGVREEEGELKLDGSSREQVDRWTQLLFEGANNTHTISHNLLDPSRARPMEIAGAWVLIVYIPRAPRNQRPVFVGKNPFGNSYRRGASGDFRCREDQVRRMFVDAEPGSRDQRILVGFALDDLDPASLAQFRRRFGLLYPDHPWSGLGDRELLEKLGGWRKDRQAGTEGLTLAGLLMFGKGHAITDADAAPKFFVDYREYLDPERSPEWSDRIYPDGKWEANLFQFYQQVLPRLGAGIPTPFRLQGGIRQDDTPAHQALREAFVNALIHSDFSGIGSIVIKRFPDRFVLENPGSLLISLEQYYQGGVSECRNRNVQKMFLRIGGGEQAGSGADRIKNGWSSRNWVTPHLELLTDTERVRLTLPMASLVPPEVLTELRNRFGTEVESLANSELQALALAQMEGAVTNSRLQTQLPDHRTDITRILGGLCQRGFLESDRKRRWTTYHLASPVVGVGSSALTLAEDSQRNATDSLHKGENSLHKPPWLPFTETTEAGPPSSRGIPEAAAGAVRAVAESRRIRDPQLIQNAILLVCQGQFWTAQELAEFLHRNVVGLQGRYLKPMVRAGLLRLRFPDQPNRPDQAYSAMETP